jgi:hypothetical protein
MKTLLKQIVRKATAVPGIGRLVRIAAAVYRLPEIREEVLALVSGHYPQGAKPAQPALWRSLAELRENTVGDANLTRSVPVALRRLTRDVQALRVQLDGAGDAGAAAIDPPRRAAQLVLSLAQPVSERTEPLRLYLGNGEPAPPGYAQVDTHAAVDALPLAPGAGDEACVSYRFETFTQSELRQQVLPQLHACLMPGGRLRVLAADAGAVLAAYAAGSCSYEELRAALYGAWEGDGQPQLNMLTPGSLGALLREAGFTVADVMQTGTRDGRAYTFEAVAEKPLATPPAH